MKNALALCTLVLGGCATDSSKDTPLPDNTMQNAPSKKDVEPNELAHLQAEVQSLSEKMRTLERNLEVLQKGKRSGIFEATPALEGIDPPSRAPLMEGPAARKVEEVPAKTLAARPAISSAAQMVADAEIKMQRAQYGEAVVLLAELQKNEPNMQDDGHALILLAECWTKLKQQENALQTLRTFYIQYPSSKFHLQGKILEAQTHEITGARESAISIYREVIAVGPKSSYANTARASLQRLRDEK